jgi:anhydro-N-acetylmuramic acid kinase
MSDFYIGLISGTSMDAVDAVVVDFSRPPGALLAGLAMPLPVPLRKDIQKLSHGDACDLNVLAKLDVELGRLFADAAQAVVAESDLKPAQIRAIGSHGQTIRHFPDGKFVTSLQIGDPNIIAEQTGITTVADFRRRDMAAGGQGAPLVPAFHAAALRSLDVDRVIVNIGGIANITLLPADARIPVTGFDTGPGNTLLDSWNNQHQGKHYDANGNWARSGKVDQILLSALMKDPFFNRKPPKSTGPDYFNLSWLEQFDATLELAPRDVQATLCALTTNGIKRAIESTTLTGAEILVCGGGVHNGYLMEQLDEALPGSKVTTTAVAGLDPDWVEATAFAWMARRTVNGEPGNLPSVTGAQHDVILGGIYPAGSI